MNNLELIRDLLNKSTIERNTKNEIFNHLGAICLLLQNKDDEIESLRKTIHKNEQYQAVHKERIDILENMIRGVLDERNY